MDREKESLEYCIFNRRSVRAFTQEAVDRDVVKALIERAAMAPSCSNAQPWVFIAVDDAEKLEKIKMFSPGINGDPPVLIVICMDMRFVHSRDELRENELCANSDIAMAAQNFMLAATAKGLGTCAIKSFRAVLVKKILDLPDNFIPELIITLGYPGKVPAMPKRKELSSIIGWNGWKERVDD